MGGVEYAVHMSDRRLSSAVFDPIRVLAVIAAALLIAGVAFEVGHATKKKDNEASSTSASTVKPGVLGSTITAPDDSTTTTAAPAVTVTTVAATATTAAPAATTATTAAPAPTTTTTRPPTRSCGNGQATAKATMSVKPGTSAGTWDENGEADVTNGTDRAIQVDKLTLRLTYTDGSSETFTPDGAIGAQLQPSQIRGFAFTRTGAKQGSTADIIEFAMHPVGSGPECASQPA